MLEVSAAENLKKTLLFVSLQSAFVPLNTLLFPEAWWESPRMAVQYCSVSPSWAIKSVVRFILELIIIE